jgi:hypothetical protein
VERAGGSPRQLNDTYYYYYTSYHLYGGYLQLPANLPASFPCKINTFGKTVKNAFTSKENSSGD